MRKNRHPLISREDLCGLITGLLLLVIACGGFGLLVLYGG